LIEPSASGKATATDVSRQGRCYELAAKAIQDRRELMEGVLLHGSLKGPVGRIGHAWVIAPGGAIYEPVSDREWPIEEFEAEFAPLEERRYTPMEALHAMIATGHWGPWWAPTVPERG
jgi:hypothetical protein